MPSYDDDDVIDYENELPDFEEEADLDDYLNDEEYELMNEILPQARKEMTDYQGWDNFALKREILETNFDLPEALKQLKRAFKKKKASEVGLQPPSRGLSRLEQLARARAAQNSTPTAAQSGTDEDRSVSLLSRLRNSERKNDLPSTSLSDRLKRKPPLTSQRSQRVSSKLPASSSETNTSQSLGSKLFTLRCQKPQVSSSDPQSQKLSSKRIRDLPEDRWRSLKSLRLASGFDQNAKIRVTDSLVLASVIMKQFDPREASQRVQKHHYYEMFTSFFPKDACCTNETKLAKMKAIENFKKPSPDDVVLEAQSNALDNVTESVAKMKMQEKAKPEYKKATKSTKPLDPVDIPSYLNKTKPHCSFVVIGHVDSGKSTLMGRLLYDLGVVDINHIRKLKRESEIVGKSSFHLAWVMDQTPEERERGVTVSVCTSDFETPNTRFTIVDAPGHRDFVPSAIAGISEADVAVLSIDCGTDAFESGFNLDGQTKEHTLLARSLGVSRIVVAMNKMDTVDWFQGRFDQIKNELALFFEGLGYLQDQISWIPCSGLSGEGVCKKSSSDTQHWYSGPTLIEELENRATEIARLYKKEVMNVPFLFSITDVISVGKNEEITVSGKVESGSIQAGETVNIFPSEQGAIVNKITIDNNERQVPIIVKGDFAALKLRNAFADIIEAGDLAASPEFQVPIRTTFRVQALTFQMDRPLLPGTPFMFFKGVNEQPARVSKLISIIDKHDPNKIIKRKVKHLGSNQAAVLEIELVDEKRWIPLLDSKQNKRLSRIVMRKEGRTIAAGTIIE
ncbi:related to Elongation factor 1 alpha-like protein [Zygosaccharomyces bailii]|nr:related to Elongation factor 1 alpha-like protein [Zygosaccharomyces bailii]